MRTILIVAITAVAFFWLGWKGKERLTEGTGKVHGIGGVFFKAKDPKTLKKWYVEKLGFIIDEYGTLFETKSTIDGTTKQYLQWSVFNEKTGYFQPSEKQFMINYRVSNIEELVTRLKKEGVTVTDSIATYEYGKFVHIMDPEMNKLELWEPVDSEFTRNFKGATMY